MWHLLFMWYRKQKIYLQMSSWFSMQLGFRLQILLKFLISGKPCLWDLNLWSVPALLRQTLICLQRCIHLRYRYRFTPMTASCGICVSCSASNKLQQHCTIISMQVNSSRWMIRKIEIEKKIKMVFWINLYFARVISTSCFSQWSANNLIADRRYRRKEAPEWKDGNSSLSLHYVTANILLVSQVEMSTKLQYPSNLLCNQKFDMVLAPETQESCSYEQLWKAFHLFTNKVHQKTEVAPNVPHLGSSSCLHHLTCTTLTIVG